MNPTGFAPLTVEAVDLAKIAAMLAPQDCRKGGATRIRALATAIRLVADAKRFIKGFTPSRPEEIELWDDLEEQKDAYYAVRREVLKPFEPPCLGDDEDLPVSKRLSKIERLGRKRGYLLLTPWLPTDALRKYVSKESHYRAVRSKSFFAAVQKSPEWQARFKQGIRVREPDEPGTSRRAAKKGDMREFWWVADGEAERLVLYFRGLEKRRTARRRAAAKRPKKPSGSR